MRVLSALLVTCFVIVSFFFSGCSWLWVTREDFFTRMDSLESKTDEILSEQQRLKNIERDLERLYSHLTTFEQVQRSGQDLIALEELRLEIQLLSVAILDHGQIDHQTKEQIDTIYERIDNLVSASLQSLLIRRELDALHGKIESRATDTYEKTRELAARIEDLERQTGTSPKESGEWQLELILGELADIRSQIGAVAFDEIIEEEHTIYTVRSGDTLWGISRAYGITIGDIREANPWLGESSLIRAGQELLVPVSIQELLVRGSVGEHLGLAKDFEALIEAIESPFGSFDFGYANPGIDLSVPAGSVVTSVLPGRVILSERINDLYGETIIIDHGHGIRTVYGRLKNRNVSQGSFVSLGDIIGSTGLGPHNLHFEFWKDETPIDPAEVLFQRAGVFEATMYTEWDDGKNPTSPTFRMTASGAIVKEFRTIAADPSVLPLGSVVYIPFFADAPNGGFFIVEDTGSSIRGNKIDIYTRDFDEAATFKRDLIVFLVGSYGG